MECKNIPAMSLTNPAVKAATVEANSEAGPGIVVKGAFSIFPFSTTTQFQSLYTEILS